MRSVLVSRGGSRGGVMGVATPPFGLGLITIFYCHVPLKVTQLVYITSVTTQPLLLKIAGSAPEATYLFS